MHRQVQKELLQLDVRTRQFCGRDPDTKNVANIFGLETTDKLVRSLWGDPDDPYTKVWHDRPDKGWLDIMYRRLPPWQSPDRWHIAVDLFPRWTKAHIWLDQRIAEPLSTWLHRARIRAADRIAPSDHHVTHEDDW